MNGNKVPSSGLDDELRVLLRSRADAVTPWGEPMAEISQRHSLRQRRRRTIAVTAAVSVAAVIGLVVAGPVRPDLWRDSGLPATSTSEEAQERSGISTVTDDSFAAEVLQRRGPVLVIVTARWCDQTCVNLEPDLQDFARAHAGTLTVVRMDFDASPETVERYDIQGVPTFLVFEDGQAVKTVFGFKTEDRLLEELDEYLCC